MILSYCAPVNEINNSTNAKQLNECTTIICYEYSFIHGTVSIYSLQSLIETMFSLTITVVNFHTWLINIFYKGTIFINILLEETATRESDYILWRLFIFGNLACHTECALILTVTVNLRVFSQLVYTVNLRKRLGCIDTKDYQDIYKFL